MSNESQHPYDSEFFRACGIDAEEAEQLSFEELEARVLLFLNTLVEALEENR